MCFFFLNEAPEPSLMNWNPKGEYNKAKPHNENTNKAAKEQHPKVTTVPVGEGSEWNWRNSIHKDRRILSWSSYQVVDCE